MATIKRTITDRTSGQPAACTVHVPSSDGGGVRVLVERGTEYVPLERR